MAAFSYETHCTGYSVSLTVQWLKIWLGVSADKIAAIYVRTVKAAKIRSLNKSCKKSPKSPKEIETGSISLCVHQVQNMPHFLS